MGEEHFRQLVEDAVYGIGDEFVEHLNNVQIVIEDEPSPRQLQDNGLQPGDTLLGLYEGVPLTKRENYTLVLPDKITIFKHVIERIARNEEDIRELVRDTVWHEIGHHFGLEEREVRRREAKHHRHHQNDK